MSHRGLRLDRDAAKAAVQGGPVMMQGTVGVRPPPRATARTSFVVPATLCHRVLSVGPG